jgi:lysophospholipase L1-like esterase
LLGTNGEPREELFEKDRLHPNADGYKILADTIRPFLPKTTPAESSGAK